MTYFSLPVHKPCPPIPLSSPGTLSRPLQTICWPLQVHHSLSIVPKFLFVLPTTLSCTSRFASKDCRISHWTWPTLPLIDLSIAPLFPFAWPVSTFIIFQLYICFPSLHKIFLVLPIPALFRLVPRSAALFR